MSTVKFSSFNLITMACVLFVSIGSAFAGPKVLASIKPVHSLVAAVMHGVGEPDILVDGTASAHDYSLKPSDAGKLQNADLVFWIGLSLETFLEKSLGNLSQNAVRVELLGSHGLHQIKLDMGEHESSGFDPHIWLNPQNAEIMLAEIERQLSALDPENSGRYRQNMANALTELDALGVEIEEMLKPVMGKPFIVFHDAYRHFEQRFGLISAGSITPSPEIMPGAERIFSLRKKVLDLDIRCVFTEVQSGSKLASIIVEGSNARIASLDPAGVSLENGPGLYFALIRDMAHTFQKCLS